jgi:hypothetical protein
LREVIGIPAREDLGFRLKPAKGSRVNNAVPVALEVVAITVLRLGMAASARIFPRAPRSAASIGKRIVSKVSEVARFKVELRTLKL